MSSPIFRFVRVTGLGALAAFIYGLLRSTRHQPTPPTSGTASWEPLVDEEPVPTRSGPVTFTATTTDATSETEDAAPAANAEVADLTPQGFASVADAPVEPADATTATTGWVEPDAEGGCPDSHPIKGNDQSKIFHVPGGMSYARTKAERCYCDEASAEADGYRKAKR
jgi:hypothetical protein